MRDATDYYNLLSDTLKNGHNQIKYLYDKIDYAIQERKYLNIRTGCLIKKKLHNNNYYFNYDKDFPLCYNFSCCGLARRRVIKKILDFYLSCLKIFDKNKDENIMKKLIKKEIENAKKNYMDLNKNNKGFDDLKLFNIPPHKNEPQEVEDSYNSSSFINDNSNSNNENDSFINDGELEEEEEIIEEKEGEEGEKGENANEGEENEDEQNENNEGNECEEGDNENDKENGSEENRNEENKRKKKKNKLMKNGKRVINEYKNELDDLLEENYDGEYDLINEENEENEDEDNYLDLELDTKYSSLKKKKLNKHYLNKKSKRSIINDSEEENEKDEKKEKEEDKKNNCEEEDVVEEIKNLLKKEEEDEEKKESNNKINNKDIINKEYYKGLKENISLKQRTLDSFLKIK